MNDPARRHHSAKDDTSIRMTDGPNRFGALSRLNHWIAAVAFLAALGLGLTLAYAGLDRETAGPLMNWHKALGLFVLGFGIWRVGWRLAQGFPQPAHPQPRWQAMTAKVVHIGLLGAILAMPISGIAMSVAAGRDVVVWSHTVISGITPLPWLETIAETVHEAAAPVLLLLLALHIGGALKHAIVDRDTTLRRMTTG